MHVHGSENMQKLIKILFLQVINFRDRNRFIEHYNIITIFIY